MEKNRKATENLLLDTVGKIVEGNGFSAIGVNAVAEQAGVSKILIYRYFGGLQGLIGAWVLKNNYWVEDTKDWEEDLALVPSEVSAIRNAMKEMFRAQWSSLKAEPLRRELLRWFIAEENPVSRKALEQIETRGREISLSFLERIETTEDIDAVNALLIGGSYYLSLIADRVDVFNGIPLSDPRGQERLYAAMDSILDRIPYTIKEEKDEN
ncbi:MAG: TetR/AcrR family transcriptional regulator [Spirochaetia bacterium]|nr:TetR/AcrR family transcriptional regulator [Spirochaetia bacterium]